MNFTKKMRLSVLLIAMLCVCNGLFAQDRGNLRKAIQEWGECKNVALTKSHGNIALYQVNGYSAYDCPKGMLESIKDIRRQNLPITDVYMTEAGKWLVLYGENGHFGFGIPELMSKQLNEYHQNRDIIISASFNDLGDWVIVTNKHFSCSSTQTQQWLLEGIRQYGDLLSVSVTDDASAAVFDRGYQWRGNIPDALANALKKTTLKVYRVKFAGKDWFFADKNGGYEYNM